MKKSKILLLLWFLLPTATVFATGNYVDRDEVTKNDGQKKAQEAQSIVRRIDPDDPDSDTPSVDGEKPYMPDIVIIADLKVAPFAPLPLPKNWTVAVVPFLTPPTAALLAGEPVEWWCWCSH
jgi:hypothetical protein